MSETLVAAIIGACVTLAVGIAAATVAVWVYVAGERARRRADATEQQRLMVIRMLDTIDDAIRSRLRPSVMRPWRNPGVDLSLALPRLLLELPKADLPVATWAAGQVQNAATTVRVRPFVDRVMHIEGKLIGWHRGDIPTAWFVDQLEAEPYNPQFQIPRRIRMIVWLRELCSYFGIGVALGVGVKGIQSLLKS